MSSVASPADRGDGSGSPFEGLSLEHSSTVERVADELRRAVFEGEIESGTPLREVALAESLARNLWRGGEPPPGAAASLGRLAERSLRCLRAAGYRTAAEIGIGNKRACCRAAGGDAQNQRTHLGHLRCG